MKNATRLTSCLLFTCAALLARPCAAAPGQWAFTGSLHTARYNHTATLLQDGRVLVAGGYNSSSVQTNSAELYDPATGTWTVTGSLNVSRVSHSAILLPNGKVLVVDGVSPAGLEKSAELFDPVTGTWSFTGTPNLYSAEANLALLPDGQVLSVTNKLAELYDPASGTWRLTGSTNFVHGGAEQLPLVLLPNGKVLYAGGVGTHGELLQTAELYDPTSGTWSITGNMNTPRQGSGVLLPSGLVLVAGGAEFNDPSAELYDPATGTWSYTGPPIADYYVGDMNLLSTGMILTTVGEDAQLYDPTTGTWSATGSLHDDHLSSHATLLISGMVLVEGGGSSVQEVLASAELYDPGMAVTATMASGRGSIAGQGDTATFNFRANLTGDRPSGSVTFRDAAAGISISKAKVRTLTFDGNSADLGGNARLGDGTRVSYTVSVTDNGDGSTDTFSLTLSNGYTAGGMLTSGDISVQ